MPTFGYRRRVFGALWLAVASATLAAQGPPAQQPQQPTFRTTVDLVAVDVNVIDATGRPVSDLTLEEFSLTVDGRPRRLRSAEFVSLSKNADERREPAAYSTNLDRPPGRLIVLVIDQANIRRGTGREVFRAAAKFIDSLTASDRVALHIIPGSGPIADFTSNHAFVKTMIERAVGQGGEAESTGRVGVTEAIAATHGDDITWRVILERECVTPDSDPNGSPECRQRIQRYVNDVYAETRATTNMSLVSLRSILDRLMLTTESKTIVLISEGLVVDPNSTDLSWIASEMAAAHATLYGIRLSAPLYMATMGRTSPTREADQQMLLTGMDDLVGRGGGAVFPAGGNADASFARLGRELSAYYLLAFEPEAGDRDGKNHDIAVKVARRGLSVRARPTFAAPSPDAPNTTRDLLTTTLRSALSAADFGVRISTYSYLDEASGRVKVILGADIDRAGPDAPLALAYYVSKLGGGLVWADEDKMPPAPSATFRSQHFMGAFVLDPGTYVVKFAVVDDRGRRASVERQFDAKVTSLGQVRLGDLMLARLGETPGKLRPVIDGRVDGDALIAYTELYSQASDQLAGATVRVDVAESEDGRALESATMTLGGSQKGKRSAQGGLSVAQLNDGDYVARAVLEMSGRDLGRVVRPFTIARGANRDARPATAAADAPAAPDTAAATRPAPIIVTAPPAPIPFESRMDRFERRSVLTRPVIGFFIDRLGAGGAPPVPESLLPAVGLARIGRFVEAAKVVDASGSDHVAGRFLAGLGDFAQGRLDEAATKFAAVLKQTPGYFPATFYLGAIYAASSQDREAVEVWRSAIVKTPEAPWTYTLLADSLMRLGENRRALDVLRDAARTWPTNDDVQLRWGIIQSKTGQGDAAVRALGQYLISHMDDTDRLFLAMRLIYDARYSRRSIESPEADHTRFERYYDAYVKANGPERALVAQWKKVMDR